MRNPGRLPRGRRRLTERERFLGFVGAADDTPNNRLAAGQWPARWMTRDDRRIDREIKMDFKKLRKVLMIGFIACLMLCAGAFGFLRWSIQNSLDEWCVKVQEDHPHPGDDVAALIAFVQSDSHSLHDRNLAVWALGQARDARALSVLQAFVTGEKCDHSKNLCQHELKKAMKLSEKDPINILGIRTPVASNH